MDNLLKIVKKKKIAYAEHADLAEYSTFHIGGPGDLLVFPKTSDELLVLAAIRIQENIPYVIIGGGSNILISDEGFRGLVIIPRFLDISMHDNSMTAGASVGLQNLLQFSVQQGLSGLEHLVGIPGSVGGALAGNAGTSTHWIESAVVSVTAVNMLTAKQEIFSKSQCAYAYRSSLFKDSEERLIVEGNFVLTPKPASEIQNVMKQYLSHRNKQPAGGSSAGCVFKNPLEIPAGKLIDELGLKGKQIGKVQISLDHGNFMLNMGGAHATDVIKLISYVKQQARDKRGIQLQEEIHYIGF